MGCERLRNTHRETIENGLYKIVVADHTGCDWQMFEWMHDVIRVNEVQQRQIEVLFRGKKASAEIKDFASSVIMASGGEVHREN